MKRIKSILITATFALILSSCTKDSDVENAVAKKTLFAENFDSTDLTSTGWTTVNQIGTVNWGQASYKSDGYAKISAYYSGTGHNGVSWLISPAIDLSTQEGEKLYFQTAQDGYVKSPANSLELFISTDYDGTNFGSANWEKANFKAAGPEDVRFIYVNSGLIDLSSYTGTINFAFKYTGYSASNLNGGYQVDNIRIFY